MADINNAINVFIKYSAYILLLLLLLLRTAYGQLAYVSNYFKSIRFDDVEA